MGTNGCEYFACLDFERFTVFAFMIFIVFYALTIKRCHQSGIHHICVTVWNAFCELNHVVFFVFTWLNLKFIFFISYLCMHMYYWTFHWKVFPSFLKYYEWIWVGFSVYESPLSFIWRRTFDLYKLPLQVTYGSNQMEHILAVVNYHACSTYFNYFK